MKDKMKILIAYDGSKCADAALADLKRAGLPRNVEARVLSVYGDWMPLPSSYGMIETNFTQYVQEWENGALASAERACSELKSSFPDWEIRAEVGGGSPAGLILQKADELKSDLIIVGSHGRSAIGRLLLGSVSQKVLHAAHGNVRIAREKTLEPDAPIRLIVGVDSSSGADAAVKAVAGRHWPPGSEARIVNAFPVIPSAGTEYVAVAIAKWFADEKARANEAVEKASKKLKAVGLTVSKAMKEEDARHSLVHEAEAWKADCVFVGAKGLGTIERFLLGSVSSFVATHAPCSVEVVREQA